jgi:hypothetical protein
MLIPYNNVMKRSYIILITLILWFTVCSDAPEVLFPEPTDRVVLAELFTGDF